MTWQNPDIRLDTGDLPGKTRSYHPQVSSVDNYIYVVWGDKRNDKGDLYFNFSQDDGTTWLASPVKIQSDYDNKFEYSYPYAPQIVGSETRVFVVWRNKGSGKNDMVFTTTNQSPRVCLGDDLLVTEGESVLLDGTSSFDPEDDRLTYSWRILSAPKGSNASFSDKHSISPLFTPDKVGTYELRLVATDAFGAKGKDKVKVEVLPPGHMLRLKSEKGGTTLPAPGIYSHVHGSKVTLQAVPNPGFVFSHWSGDASGKKNPKIISMYRDKKIKAHFIRE